MSDPTKRTIDDWLADLEQSEAEADSGLTVPLAPALEKARDAIARLEAKARGEKQREGVRPS